MIIMKFGGSSLATAERIRHVAQIIKNHLREEPVIVLSAMGKSTDHLLQGAYAALNGSIEIKSIEELHRQTAIDLEIRLEKIDALLEELRGILERVMLLKELTPKTRDHVLSFGERLAVRVFSLYLEKEGLSTVFLDGWDVGIETSSDFGRAEVLPHSEQNVLAYFSTLEKKSVPIITGFIGKDTGGSITTLGRGGSDLTASFLGSWLNAKEIQVWKDVDGIHTTDPKLIPTALPISQVSFSEAAELAYFGAKVLHPQSILPAMQKGIPVCVKNSYRPAEPGTLIMAELKSSGQSVTAIALKEDQVLVHIVSTRMLGAWGYLAAVFQIFAELKVCVDVIATSEVSISLTLEKGERLEPLKNRLGQIANVQMKRGKTIISLIGDPLFSQEVLMQALQALSAHGIDVDMVSHGASKINTSLVVEDHVAKDAAEILHTLFFCKKGSLL